MTNLSSPEESSDYGNETSDSEQLTGKDVKRLKKPEFSRLADSSAKKRKASDSEDSDSEDELEEYEKKVRKNNFVPDKKMRTLLPVKTRDGILHKSVPIESTDPDNEAVTEQLDENGADHDARNVEQHHKNEPQAYVESLANKYKEAQIKKHRIGVLASTIVEDPQEHWLLFRELIGMLTEPGASPVVQRWVTLSLLEVLKDVVPGYAIRPLAEEERGKKLKKETRALQGYEEALLRYYKRFLVFLNKTLTSYAKFLRSSKKKRKPRQTDPTSRLRCSLARACAQSACGLLVAHPHFNYRSHLVMLAVDCLGSTDGHVSNTARIALSQLYRQDRLGEAALDAVKRTKALIKSRNFKVQPRVLFPFLSLRIRDVRPDKNRKPDMEKVREKWKKMSRTERDKTKQMLKLEAQLRETKAQESGERKDHFQASILKQVFWTYFHVLKAGHVDLLGPVLEGLARFAHMINLEFFDDLVNVLHGLINELKPRDTLHCLITIFTVLSGQGDVLNVDPQRFYSVFYRSLLGGKGPLNAKPLLNCFDLMIVRRRRRLSVSRLLAFLKRLATLALSHDACLSLLLSIRGVISVDRRLDILIDTESDNAGMFRPDLGDEEGAAVPAGTLWELHLLRRYFAPKVRTVARYLAEGAEGVLPQGIGKANPKEVVDEDAFEGLPDLCPRKGKPHFTAGKGVCSTAVKLFSFVDDWPSSKT
ncbi:nucleolar complex protein 3 homolog [Ornithodoros turicata]|uniref:nucleolar complex protein 3 homolog n=1 Tax=Ornithodoros turicata TaxID=34597 RepID=UPI003139574F